VFSATAPGGGAPYLPLTADWIVEKVGTHPNENYGSDLMYGVAYDNNGAPHIDPGGPGPDPYVVNQAFGNTRGLDGSIRLNLANWGNGRTGGDPTNPADPMEFIWNSAN
jgi:hypothetical protein